MKSLDHCIIYTQDDALSQKVDLVLKFSCTVQHVDNSQQLETTLSQNKSTILLVDLRGHDIRRILPWVLHDLPQTVVIVLADQDSVSAREAQAMGVYAVEPLEFDRVAFTGLVSRAQAYLRLMKENTILKKTVVETMAIHPVASEIPSSESSVKILSQFFKAFRNFDNINTMLEGMIDGISSCAGISRVGIFATTDDKNDYQLMAGNKCLESSYKIKVPANDPIIHWMNINVHIISRSGLAHLHDTSERLLLQQWLDLLGAEAMVPLYGRKQIIGWILVGRRATGEALDQSDLETLSILGDHVSTMLENALLYEKLTIQNTLTDTVFDSVPAGIVAVGADGIINWVNQAAEEILKVSALSVKGCSVEKLSTQLADQLNRCMSDIPLDGAIDWVDPDTQRSLSVVVRKLTSGVDNRCSGAVALIHDFTRERILKAEERRVARAAFWTDLAAAMSHEIRNPLVAISTFAQLLPDSYTDPEFRDDFSKLVSEEVSRLNAMVDQINEFANYPESDLKDIEIKTVMKKVLAIVGSDLKKKNIPIDIKYENITSGIHGDNTALAEALVHLIRNSMEALVKIEKPLIQVNITEVSEAVRNPALVIRIRDNGPGIATEVVAKVFSPFYSTKNRGIGLGLPIVKRTLEDHNGSITIDSHANGGDVTVTLPLTK